MGDLAALAAASLACATGLMCLIGAALAAPGSEEGGQTALGAVAAPLAVAAAAIAGWLYASGHAAAAVGTSGGVLVLTAAAVWGRRQGHGRPGDDGPGGGGGGGGRRPPVRPPGGPGGLDVDWEAFEREFWAHVEHGGDRLITRA